MIASGSLGAAFCLRLSETLGHFLWQGAAIALLVAVADACLRGARARVRYMVFVAAIGLIAACPPVTFAILSHLASPSNGPTASRAERVAAHEAGHPLPDPPLPASDSFPDATVGGNPSSLMSAIKELGDGRLSRPASLDWRSFAPHVVLAYFLGVGLMLGRLLLSLRGCQTLRKQAQPAGDHALCEAVARRAKAVGLSVVPAIAYCRSVAAPTVVGVVRPMILLPIALAGGLSPAHLELLLAHEIAHIRRYDHLVNIFQCLIESLLFYHPAVWFVSRRIRTERELCCDEIAADSDVSRTSYAAGLLRVAELCSFGRVAKGVVTVTALGAIDRPSSLRVRVSRLLGGPAHPPLRVRNVGWLLTGTAVLLGLGAAPYLNLSGEVSAAVAKTNHEASKCSAALPGGVTIELLGVASDTYDGRQAWRPDGSPPTGDLPRGEMGIKPSRTDSRVYHFPIRLEGAEEVVTQLRFPAAASFGVHCAPGAGDARALTVSADLPQDQSTASFRLGLASSQWETWATSPGGTSFTSHEPDRAYHFLFGDAHESERGVGISVAHDVLHVEHRIVAIDSAGRALIPTSQSSGSAGSFRQTNARFETLSVGEVLEFRFQILRDRAYRWVEFRDVSLSPGQQTEAQIVTLSSVADAEKPVGASQPRGAGAGAGRRREAPQLGSLWTFLKRQSSGDGRPVPESVRHPVDSRLVEPSPGRVDVVIDNADPQVRFEGDWQWRLMSQDKFGADYRFAQDGSGKGAATFTPDLPVAGRYDVYAWWPEGFNRTRAAEYTVRHRDKATTTLRDQSKRGGRWNLLGRFNFDAGTGGSVVLSDKVPVGRATVVMADAVRWVLVPEDAEEVDEQRDSRFR